MASKPQSPQEAIRGHCRDKALRALLLAALECPGVKAHSTAYGLMVHGPSGSAVLSLESRGGDPNQLKRTRGQLRRIGVVP
jgi:hypothetical protein